MTKMWAFLTLSYVETLFRKVTSFTCLHAITLKITLHFSFCIPVKWRKIDVFRIFAVTSHVSRVKPWKFDC